MINNITSIGSYKINDKSDSSKFQTPSTKVSSYSKLPSPSVATAEVNATLANPRNKRYLALRETQDAALLNIIK